MEKYEPRVLRKLQLTELEILKDFDAICRKNSIPYVVFYGTGIGVLRHGGFIPWDDDIDVMLLRKDVEKLIKVLKEKFSETHQVLSAEEDVNFPLMTIQWGPKETTFILPEFKDLPCKFTIFLDIFPLDSISDDEDKQRKQCYSAWFWQKLMLLRQMPNPVIQYRGLKRKAFYFICGAIHIGMKIMHISPKWLYKKCKAACLQYQDERTNKVAFLTDTRPGMSVFTTDELFPPRYLEFEGVKLPFPNKIETLLTRHYGDYMQLPPEEERRNHFPAVLDFGDGERYENDS